MTTGSLTHIERKGTDILNDSPVIVLLHGYGSNEQDLFGLTPYFDESYTVISVRAPQVLAQNRYAWFETGFTDDGLTYIPQQVLAATEQLGQFLTEVSSARSIPANQITLFGFSQGAMMSALVALTQPQRIGRAILLSGLVPPEAHTHLTDAAKRAHLNLFVGHGLFDDIVPIEHGRATNDLLTSLNIAHVYREYATTHSIHDECLDDILTWLDETEQ